MEYTQKDFLEAVFSRCTEGRVFFRFLPSAQGIYRDLDERTNAPKQPANQDAYFAIAPRNGGATKAHITQILAHHNDVDIRSPKHPNAVHTEESARKAVYNCDPPPTVVVDSGSGGLNVYWLLKDPLGKEFIPDVERINAALTRQTGGDPVQDASRLLRLPGTLNYGYDPPRLAKVEFMDLSRLYTLNSFAHLIIDPKDEPRTEKTGQPEFGEDWLQEVMGPVPQGKRNAAIAKYAGWMLRQGHPPERVEEACQIVNERYAPPLSKAEVKKTVASIAKAHTRNNAGTEDKAVKRIFDEITSRTMVSNEDGDITYELTFKNGRQAFPGPAAFSSVNKFETAFRHPLGRSPRLTKKQIDDLYDLVVTGITEEKASLEESNCGALLMEIASALKITKDKFEACESNPLFEKNGNDPKAKGAPRMVCEVAGFVFVNGTGLEGYIKSLQSNQLFIMDNVNRLVICRMLRKLGFRNKSMRLPGYDGVVTHTWRMPRKLFDKKLQGSEESATLGEAAAKETL